MSEVTFLSRHYSETEPEMGGRQDSHDLGRLLRLTLAQASLIWGLAIHELKRATREGRLQTS